MDQNFVGMLLKAIEDRMEQVSDAIVSGKCGSYDQYLASVAVYTENERFKEVVKEVVDKWNKQWDR